MTSKPLLGELLVQKNMVSQETVNQALKLQVGGLRRLGHILVRMKAITDDQLAEILASQLDVPITQISEAYSEEVKKTLPRYLCRQYGVMPLRFKANNVLEIAMANPSDHEAISDLEHYTGTVIAPCLARHSDIENEIPRRIPFGIRDIFSPQANTLLTRAIASFALICAVSVGLYTLNYVKEARDGTISVSADMTLYHNHDLTLAVDNKGTYSLQGHGAFADGLYKAEFSDIQYLEKFVNQRQNDFSDKQHKWLKWAIQTADQNNEKSLLAQN
ncbi:hypothetical protein [Desulfosediminicola flagellatus]|uniref:GspE/PulE/PilB domain-containing protein n=1 Tax=Desulfosediminicola flagellatus TaxID=2569541 RepID=UPI0010ABFFFE|nr:hypothetical protein [Desulfosediminicola flagellatus]